MAGPCAMAGDGSGRERADIGTAMVENTASMVLVDAGTLRPHARTAGALAWTQGMTHVPCMLEPLSLAW